MRRRKEAAIKGYSHVKIGFKMTIWGKVFGGITGLSLGGPLGGLVGLALGHMADKETLLTPISGTWKQNFPSHGARDPFGMSFFTSAKFSSLIGKRDQLYSIGVIMLCAKIAKCDGFVNKAEIQAFKNTFQFPKEHHKIIGKIFDNAYQRVDDFELYARELGTAFQHDKAPLEFLLSVLFHIARADLPPYAPLHPEEIQFLQKTCKALGLSKAAWERAEKGQPRTAPQKIEESYKILGISPHTSSEKIRKKWRSLMRLHHPDRLAQQNLSEQDLKKAQEHISKINAAWDHIKKERGI